MISSEDKLRLNELVDKINRSFVIVAVFSLVLLLWKLNTFIQVVPRMPETLDQPIDVSNMDVSSMDISSMDVEIPFIPAPQRSIKALEDEEQDTIVVVGQARRKRKRPKASPDGVEAVSSSAGEKIKKTKVKNGDEAKDEDVEVFDFSAVPNILDDNPNLGNEKNNKKRREKRVKKGENFFSSFFFPTHWHFYPNLHRRFSLT